MLGCGEPALFPRGRRKETRLPNGLPEFTALSPWVGGGFLAMSHQMTGTTVRSQDATTLGIAI